ncbi:right-handed parallel beta-helix repeat-containing protein [Halorussus amylolyticus]|uniref:right-handed parallel beta-helix repeat-containing protein n=1 Tax=Halorussus amylolyticus TaxID=1126242 RepID=UPI00104B49CF|nr:right-handed parallel beta-helix repeat-containing protein [Halorussus amylolyticus]
MYSDSSRKFSIIFLAACLLASTGFAASSSTAAITYVESDVTGDTTWSPDDGPYRIAEDITIREGATLEIEPGTRVQPAEDITITVEGNLTAAGTADEPIRFATPPQTPSDIRWGTIRYDGTPDSKLSLSHVAIERATNGVTVTSDDGAVDIASTEIRSISENGIEVTETTSPPKLSIAESAFSNVGGRGVAVAPGTGAVADSKITPNSSWLGGPAVHDVELSVHARTTTETLEFAYHGHGDVESVDADSIRRVGIDTDDDGRIDRNVTTHVTGVGHPRSNAFAIALNRSLTVPAGASLVATYDNVSNPRTYGSYPVTVSLRENGVEQISETTLPLDIRSDGESRSASDSERSRASRFEIVDSTFRDIDDQGVFVAGDVAHNFAVENNTIADTRGTGITIRGERVHSGTVDRNRLSRFGSGADGVRIAAQRVADFDVRENRVANADAGVGVYTRNDDVRGLRVDSNAVRDSTTGLRIRHSDTSFIDRLELTVANNRFSNNAEHGVSAAVDNARVTGLDFRNNTLAENGRTGVHLDAGRVAHSALTNNTIRANAQAGVEIESRQIRHLRIDDNEVADNRGQGVSMQTSLLVHEVSLEANRVLDNAGVGLDLDNQLTHAGTLSLSRNVVAANAYGIRVAGSVNTQVRNNSVVYNTYGFGAPNRFGGYDTGTGIIVEEGAAGAIFRRGEVDEELSELLDDPTVETRFRPQAGSEYTVVLRPDAPSKVWQTDESALTVREVSQDLPTGITLPKDDDRGVGFVVRDNDVYGHNRGLVVNVGTLVDANTSTRLLVNTTQTVRAEHNYWGASDGPTHSSLHPEGTGDRIVTRQGWVDFLPSAESHVRTRYERPTANLTASPSSPATGDEVTISGRGSSAPNGAISNYRFATNRSVRTTADSDIAVSFEEPGDHTVRLSVEDELGIESDRSAAKTISVRQRENETDSTDTTSATTSSANESETTTRVSTQNAGFPLSQHPIFTSIGGLLGGVLYGVGLALGGYGTVQTFRSTPVTVDGLTVNGFAGFGVLTWVVFGLLGTDGLLGVGVRGGLLWVGLVALLWVLTVLRN